MFSARHSQRLLFNPNVTKSSDTGFPVHRTGVTVLLRPVDLPTGKSFPVWDPSLSWQLWFGGSSSKFVFTQICIGWFGILLCLEKRKIVSSFSVSQGTMAGNDSKK